MTDEPPIITKFLVLILFLVYIVQVSAQKPLERQLDPIEEGLLIESGNTLRAAAELFYVRPLVYPVLLNCLSFYESSHNPEAVGQAGEIGQLQFMPSTFEHYCDGDINNPEDQFQCADQMIVDNFQNVRHWMTIDMCL